jgi:hypothetical protein
LSPLRSLPQLAVIIEQAGLFIAKTTIESSRTSLPEVDFFSQWPIFNHITAQFPQLKFLDFDITTTHTFQYGPICIAKEYRKGLINSFLNS